MTATYELVHQANQATKHERSGYLLETFESALDELLFRPALPHLPQSASVINCITDSAVCDMCRPGECRRLPSLLLLLPQYEPQSSV